jgi:hypothetical protein
LAIKVNNEITGKLDSKCIYYNKYYSTTLIPDQAQKFKSGIKSSKVVMKLTIYLCLRYTQVAEKSYIFIGREQGLITGYENIGR